MKISKKNAEHYNWGDNCDGWHLVKSTHLSIIHEKMPPHTSEVRHFHKHSRQFFFVLSGALTLEVDGEIIQLKCNEGYEIHPGVPHQAFNNTNTISEFLVTSQPNSSGDKEIL